MEAQMRYTPRPPQPVPTAQISMTGQVFFPPGPWGSKRPARTVQLLVRDGFVANPRTQYSTKLLIRPEMMSSGRIERIYTDKGVLATPVFTSRNGEFRIFTRPIPINVSGLILDITDYSQIIYTNDKILTCYQELMPGRISLQNTADQPLGEIILPWVPTLTLTTLARVESRVLVDTQKLARCLQMLIKSPAYPVKISLSGQAQVHSYDPSVADDGLTETQRIFDQIAKGNLPADFSNSLMKEINAVGLMPTAATPTAEFFIRVLERFTTLNITELEKGTALNPLLSALYKVFSGYNASYMMEDAPVDAAAALTLVAMAALMAKDNVKPLVTMGSKSLSNSQKLVTIDITIVRN